MYISRPTDPRTVLLWGDRWWFPTGESCEFQTPAHAVEVLAAHYAGEPKPVRLRLIYQPDGFESFAVACPQGDRRILREALADQYPALAADGQAWSHEPVMAVGEGYSTVLHFEGRPELFDLAAKLAHRGLAIDSAWPLATFLNGVPDERSESGAITVAALQENRGVAYRHPADGVRMARVWQGADTLAQAGPWLAEVLRHDSAESVLLICPDEATVARVGAHLAGEFPALEIIRLADALGRNVILPRYHPAQLLPRTPVVTSQRVAIAASLALLLGAGWGGLRTAHDWTDARAKAAAQAAEVVALRSEVARLRGNATEIAALRALVNAGTTETPYAGFLQNLARTLPPDLALAGLRLSGRAIAFDGWLSPQAAAGALEQWRALLSPAGAPWNIAFTATTGGAFSAKGTFQP
jgi:hypothetical protein